MGTGGLFRTLKEVCNLFGKREAARWAQGGAWKPGGGLCAGRQDGREEPSGVGRTEKMWLWWGWGHREPGHIGSGRALNKQITQCLQRHNPGNTGSVPLPLESALGQIS